MLSTVFIFLIICTLQRGYWNVLISAFFDVLKVISPGTLYWRYGVESGRIFLKL